MVVSFARIVSGAEKNHLIEAAPFGRLDQMLSTIVLGGVCKALPPSQKLEGLRGSASQPKFEKNSKKS